MVWNLFGKPKKKPVKKQLKKNPNSPSKTISDSAKVKDNSKSVPISEKKVEKKVIVNKPNDLDKKIASIKDEYLKKQAEIEAFRKSLSRKDKVKDKQIEPDKTKKDVSQIKPKQKEKVQEKKNIKPAETPKEVLKVFDYLKNEFSNSLISGFAVDKQTKNIIYKLNNKIKVNNFNKFIFDIEGVVTDGNILEEINEYVFVNLKNKHFLFVQNLAKYHIYIIGNDDINIGMLINVIKNTLVKLTK